MRTLALLFISVTTMSCLATKKYPDKPVLFDPDRGTVMEHIAADIPTIVYLGEDWCPYCQRAKKIFNENAKPLQGVIKFVVVDLDAHETVHIGNDKVGAALSRLRGIPQFIVTKDSKTVLYVGNGDPLRFIQRLLQEQQNDAQPTP